MFAYAIGYVLFISFLGAMGKLYGAATLVGKDERNGRINPALETDEDDIPPPAPTDKLVGSLGQTGSGGGSWSAATIPDSTQTTF